MPGDPLLARPSAESVLPHKGEEERRLQRAAVAARLIRAGRSPARGGRRRLALAGLVALLRLVDDVDAALAVHDLVVAVAPAQRLQRIADLQRSDLRRVTVVEDRPIANEKRTGRGIDEDQAGAPSAWC